METIPLDPAVTQVPGAALTWSKCQLLQALCFFIQLTFPLTSHSPPLWPPELSHSPPAPISCPPWRGPALPAAALSSGDTRLHVGLQSPSLHRSGSCQEAQDHLSG